MRFIETKVFTKRITVLLTDVEYNEMQSALALNPGLGQVIQGTGGLRKVRWGQSQRRKGKRGGIRTIYYWHSGEGVFYMLLAYEKSEQDDLTTEQKRFLKKIVEEEFK